MDTLKILGLRPAVQRFSILAQLKQVTRALEESKAQNQALEARNNELFAANARSDESIRAKTAFLASMSHEIRTPMNAILGMADLLWETPLDPDQRQYVEVFRRAGGNLLALINDILDVSEIESGNLVLNASPFDLQEVAERTIASISPKAAAKATALFFRIAPDLQTSLIGDPGRLQQILANFLENAIKFSETGQVVLSIQADASGIPGYLEITVSDTGIGIAPENHEAIFEDFSHADTSNTRKYGRTGLGLAICQRLVQRMGGQITVRSVVGKGSEFRFNVKVQVDPALMRELPDFSGGSVLVIGNNPTGCLILRETLASWGLDVCECGGAACASKELSTAERAGQPFGVIIIDVQLSDVDAFEAVPSIRVIAPQIPIIMLMSDDRPGDPARRRKAGVSGYAIKPVKRADLLCLVSDALGTASSGGTAVHSGSDCVAASYPVPGSLRILIAEDSADNRILLQAYLKNSTHTLTAVENGKHAVERFARNEYDLVLMDVEMPVMDGLSATRAIRLIEKTQSRNPVPVIAVTAGAFADDIAASREAGCDTHLSKPVSKESLIDAIARHLPPRVLGLKVHPGVDSTPVSLEELVPKYLERRKRDLLVMSQLLQAGDFHRIRMMAHDLKGTGTSFGFPDLTTLGHAMEISAGQASTVALFEQLSALQECLAGIQAEKSVITA